MLEKELSQFSGTECYYRHYSGLTYTDGINHLKDNGGEWLIEAIGIFYSRIMANREMNAFCLWTLTQDKKLGVSILEGKPDEGREPLIHQTIDYSLPIETLRLYQIDGILLLPGEY